MWGQTNSTAQGAATASITLDIYGYLGTCGRRKLGWQGRGQGAVAPLSPLAPPLRKLEHYPVLYKCIIWPDCMCMVEFSVYYRLKFAVDTSYSCS